MGRRRQVALGEVSLAKIERVDAERARRARERQLDYMRGIAKAWEGREEQVSADMAAKSRRVRSMLEAIRPVRPDDHVLEVGSGGTGIIFNFGGERLVGLDPLADELRQLFPWQRNSPVPTIAGEGESLPFADATFDIVLSDNVVDHARDPAKILAEIVRVLKVGGLFYFSVHVHHPVYHFSSIAYGWWRRLGLPGEITPFADHTVHLTPVAAQRLLEELPLRIHACSTDYAEARQAASKPPRHLGDRLKRLFFKNATFEAVAERTAD